LLKLITSRIHWKSALTAIGVITIMGCADYVQANPLVKEHPFFAATLTFVIGLCTNSLKDKLKETDDNHN